MKRFIINTMKRSALFSLKSSLLSCCLLFSVYSSLRAQPAEILEGIDPTDFYAIQQKANKYYEDNPHASGYKQWKRTEYYLQTRLGENGSIINTNLRNISEWATYQKTHLGSRSTPHGAWIFYGPNAMNDPNPNDENGYGLGRLNVVRIHPTNPNTIYVGSASGGVWKSTTGGDAWFNLTPYLPSLSIKDIVINPTDPENIFALTGDGFNNSHPSIGIIKSSDGGNTWQPTNAPAFKGAPQKLLMHPTNPAIQYAAIADTLYKTNDSWNSYTTILNAKTYDIEFKPDDPSTIYVATDTDIRKKIGTGSWITVSDPDFLSWPTPRYIRLGVSADEPQCIYAFVTQNNGPVGLYRSMNAGANNTWTIQDESIPGLGGQGSYNQSFEVSETDFEDLSIGMVWTRISRSGGTPGTWVAPANYVNRDSHNSLFRNSVAYYVNDGGLFKSTSGDSIFENLSSGLGVTEIWGFTGTALDPNLYYCGTQDNGTNKRTGTNTFDRVLGGDGGNCMIDYTNIDIIYATHEKGYIKRSTNGGDSFTDINPPGLGAWVSPLLMDPVDPETIFIGKDTLWRSDNKGDDWVNLGKPINSGGLILRIAQGTNNRERLYASNQRFEDNKLFKLNNAISSTGNPTWVNITGDLAEGTITGLCVNPDNADHLYVCLSNIVPESKVFRSLDGGNSGSWENLTGSLPDVPINCIEFHDNGENNNALYVGTDIGVFYRDDDLDDWIYFSNYMPVVNVMDLYINTAANIIAAGTYGRGIWISSTYSGCNDNLNLSSNPGVPVGGVKYYSAVNTIESTAEYRSDLGTEINYSGGSYIDLKTGFKAGGYGFFNGKIGPCPSEVISLDLQQSPHGRPFDTEAWLKGLKDWK